MFILEDEKETSQFTARLCVVGVGGGGSNAVETMVKNKVKGVDFLIVNTDTQALDGSFVKKRMQLGSKITKGLGAGANPEIGRKAAVESYQDMVDFLKGYDMVFITAGMGGGTGTGGAPVIAEIAKSSGALTVGIVTKPFLFEGKRRRAHAEQGIEELKRNVDTLIVIPNDKLLEVCDEEMPLLQTFDKTNDVLLQAVKGISDLISVKGLINLDFADVRTVMSNKGMALMGMGEASGKDRAVQAVSKACTSPLLENISIDGATGVIVNMTGGPDLSLSEVNKATLLVTEVIDDNADIIVGAVIDKNMGDQIRVTVVATGFENFVQKPKGNFSKILDASKKEEEKALNPDVEPECVDAFEGGSEEKEIVQAEDDGDHDEAVDGDGSEEKEIIQAKDDGDHDEAVDGDGSEEKEIVQASEDSSEATKEKLLSRLKAYKEQEELQAPTEKSGEESQVHMSWNEDSTTKDELPFESEMDISEEDLID